MDKHWPSEFDTTELLHPRSPFGEAKDRLRPDTLEILARDIIAHAARLAASTGQTPRYEAPRERLVRFCDLLLADDATGALELVQAERADGLSLRDVYSGYISASARRFGRMWDRDEISFVDVTVATGYLYGLLRALQPAGPLTKGTSPQKSALFATVPGETHGLGVTMASDIFRREGWKIDLHVGLGHNELISEIAEIMPHLIGLSISGTGRLDALVRMCTSIRLTAPQALIAVAGVGAETGIAELADVDFVFDSADEAERQLARLMQMRDG